MTPTVFFSTPRLAARAMVPADVAPFVAYRAHPDVARFQSWETYTLAEGRALIDEMQTVRPAGNRGGMLRRPGQAE